MRTWRRPGAPALLAAALFPLPAAAQFSATPGELVARMDADGDRRISLREYQSYLMRGFRARDRNGDGVLQADELPPGTRRSIDLTRHEANLAKSFRRQDTDGDGYLDARELLAPPR
ncbi:MAG TPA: hypothetical protein VFG21_04895 [Xanthomonadaceae bacterium]|nr:hypothetical protein [Xanthomonadaceae bacterium]